MIEALKYYRKHKFFQDFQLCFPENSKYVTLIHGDVWTNNFFVNSNETEVTFVDFQTLQTSHPARDFWYFIYTSTDSEWRKKHLEECFETYFETFSQYFSQANISMTFGDFKKEFNSKRGFGVAWGFFVIHIMLNEDPEINFSEISGIKKMLKFRNEKFAEPIKETEEKYVKDINRRILDLIDESYDLGLLKDSNKPF